MRYDARDWSLEIPHGWTYEPGRHCTSFFHPEGVGTFQISSALKPETVTDNDLKEFAGDARLSPVSFGALSGFRTRYSEDHKFWMKCWLRAGRQVVFATYNCPLDEHGTEDAEVGAMLQSLDSAYA